MLVVNIRSQKRWDYSGLSALFHINALTWGQLKLLSAVGYSDRTNAIILFSSIVIIALAKIEN